ncbi:hypothetical protein GOEFS_110_00090 [Gordonia effusa NBRC 100432]|uniref:Uncharacterized protein n=1 Tax=Gordonia effusa NBRC 100432 TaxID=1077974 RepID=H0R5D0_9ACTN|nr:hypothetical protein GOEFS_110_00090 [Gordonia effusa NBRC 100432]
MSRFVDDRPFLSEPSGPPRTLAVLLNRLSVEFKSEDVRRKSVDAWLSHNVPTPRLERELRAEHLLR